MARAKKTYKGYDEIFPNRLRSIMNEKNIKQQELADICGVSRQSVSYWQNGDSVPDAMQLKKIAEHLEVSSDYLIGLTSTPTTDIEMRTICDLTGLSEDSLEHLYSWSATANSINTTFRFLYILNRLITKNYAADIFFSVDNFVDVLLKLKVIEDKYVFDEEFNVAKDEYMDDFDYADIFNCYNEFRNDSSLSEIQKDLLNYRRIHSRDLDYVQFKIEKALLRFLEGLKKDIYKDYSSFKND